ncbi:MAG: site-2 protease family protein [bacterium]
MTLHDLAFFITSKVLPLVLSIIGFGLLIIIHELGHFIFCKAFKIHTPTFSVGFGPKIIEKKIGSTNFRISKIPIGGYVEIAGLAEPGQGEQEHATLTGENSFDAKPFWQKFFVLFGGILFNLIFAYLAFCTIFIVGDRGKKQIITISHVAPNSPAQKAGMLENDQVLSIDNQSLLAQEGKTVKDSLETFLEIIRQNPEKSISITVLRSVTQDAIKKDQELPLTIQPEKVIENNVAVGKIGIYPSIPMPKLPFFQAIKTGFFYTNEWIINMAMSIKNLFTQKSLEGVGGPVMILAQGFKFAQGGLVSLLLFLAIISISLALINLLPLGVTDGGQLLLVSIESIIRRPIPDSVRIGINIVSIGLFAILFVYLTYRDILKLFGATFVSIYKKILVLLGQ